MFYLFIYFLLYYYFTFVHRTSPKSNLLGRVFLFRCYYLCIIYLDAYIIGFLFFLIVPYLQKVFKNLCQSLEQLLPHYQCANTLKLCDFYMTKPPTQKLIAMLSWKFSQYQTTRLIYHLHCNIKTPFHPLPVVPASLMIQNALKESVLLLIIMTRFLNKLRVWIKK